MMKKNVRFLHAFMVVMILVLISGTITAFAAPTSTGKGYSYDFLNNYDDDYYGRFRDSKMSISVYNWGEYISDGSDGMVDVCGAFTELTGINVYYTNFATNEELYAKIKSGGASYDVIIPSDYMIARMIKEDMLAPLDKSNIPTIANMDERFMSPEYDPGSTYSIPYTWGTVAIIYNTKMVDEIPTSWDIFWNEKYKGQILMFSNSRDAFAIACKMLGYSLNTEDPDELREATDALKEQKNLIQAYVMDQIFDKMENNEAALAPYYAGDAALMLPNNPDLAVAFPDEGTNAFVDGICIPKDSKKKVAAEMFINFLNEPEIAAQNIEYIGYSSPNNAALALLPDEVRQNEVIYPPDEVMDNSEQFINLSDDTNLLMDRLWTEVLASNDSFVSWGLPPLIVLLAIIIGKMIYKQKKKKAYQKMIENIDE